MPNITGLPKNFDGGAQLTHGQLLLEFYGTDARVDGEDVRLGFKVLEIKDLTDPLTLDAGVYRFTFSTRASSVTANGRPLFATKSFAWDLTADVSWGDIFAANISVPEMTPSLVQQAKTYRDEAEMFSGTVEGLQDDAVEALVTDDASATSVALSSAFVPGGAEVSAGARRGVLGGLPAAPFVGAALDLPSPYSNDSQYVHPDVVDAGPGLWNGWRYWMAATPYPHGDAGKENPCILVSADGLNWQEPTGITNPVIAPPAPPRWNSDPDMLLVGGTMHLFVRESATDGEWMKHLTSTNGITWTNLGTVIDAGTGNPQGNAIISPGVIHDGTQFVMWTSKSFTTIEKRTSSDGTTWSAPTACTLTNYQGAGIGHVDAIRKADGSLLLLVQAQDDPSSNPEAPSARMIWLARANSAGTAWTFDDSPLLDSRGLGTRNVYRTCGLHETRGGDDYLRLWYSGIDIDHKGREVWRIGYTEGYVPDASRPATGLSLPGNVEVGGDMSVRHMGARRVFSRLVVGTRGVFSYLSAWRADFGHAYVDQSASSSTTPFWKDLFGYATGKVAPLVIASAKDRESFNGARAEVRFHQRGTDNSGIEAKDYWSIRTLADGSLELMWFDFSTSTEKVVARFTNVADLLTGLRDITITRTLKSTGGNIHADAGTVKGSIAVFGGKADFGTGAAGDQPSNNPLRVLGDNLRITTARTPTGTADANLNTGAICWDDGFIYVKTSAGWKRAALTSF